MADLPYILCVDDQKDVLDTLAAQLENSSLSSEFAFEYSESGSELLEIVDDLQANGHPIAVVISDQIMPQMQGNELLARIHKKSPATNKILLTGESRIESIVNAINCANLYRFIAKPWDKYDLLLTVEEAARSYVRSQEHNAQNQLLQRLYEISLTLTKSTNIDSLIFEIMQQVMHHTQTTRGALILVNGQGLLQVYPFLRSEPTAGDSLPFFAADTSRQVPYAVIDRVLSSSQTIVCPYVNAQTAEEWLLRDPYIRHHKPKSLICQPLIHQDQLIGLLYLEHCYRSATLSPMSLRFLELLAPNLAVSLHNANLYAELLAKKDKIAEQKQLVEEQIYELQQSIQATRRIQDALLPDLDELKPAFADRALLYRPRDVISGDFVWHRRIGEHELIAVGDCTGHGIPGAMVSVLGTNLLDRITTDLGIDQPAAILAKLDELIIATLHQEQRAVSEGMDLALIRYNPATRTLVFAGANRPLYHLRADDLTEIKGDRWGVGGYESEVKTYQEHEFKLKAGDRLVLFSDGLADQFGGPSQDRKFTNRRLRQHFIESCTFPLSQTIDELELFLNAWQGTTPQTDDITLLALQC
jgi:serine phosphatase RsbU (regulator of sigma subunit)